MRQVYSPANAPEAHMLLHLLEQAGIGAHLHGEALQGAAGDLPVSDVLRILVADEDYDRARSLLLDWEKVEAPATLDNPPKHRFPTNIALIFLVLGLVGGWTLAGVVAQSHVSIGDHTREEDRNGDGRVDSTWYYRVGALHSYKGEFDHNHDGRIDVRTFYDETGTPTEQDEDEDFNGTFETKEFLVSGVLRRIEIDTDGNGLADVIQNYVHGVLVNEEITDERLGTVVRVNNYLHHRLASADIDLDRDGFRETRRTFDNFGEIIRTETLYRQ